MIKYYFLIVVDVEVDVDVRGGVMWEEDQDLKAWSCSWWKSEEMRSATCVGRS